jgi:hypothetical protein
MPSPSKGLHAPWDFSIDSRRNSPTFPSQYRRSSFSPTIRIVPRLPSRLFINHRPSTAPASTRTRVFPAPSPLRFWHLASLDAPSVALVWSLSFAWAAHVRLPLWVPALLMLAVWAVYVADRLLDACNGLRDGNLQALRERHLFHWRYRRAFLPLAVLASAAAAFLVFDLMPTGARERNSVLAAASLVYFTRVHAARGLQSPLLRRLWTPFPKELLVGLLFTAGCVIPAWSRFSLPGSVAPVPSLLAPAVFYSILAWLNCHAIDQWESAASNKAPQRISFAAGIVAVTGLLVSALLLHAQPRSAALLAAGAMAALLLALLDATRSRLAPVALRAAADLALLTPALLTPLLMLPAARLLP